MNQPKRQQHVTSQAEWHKSRLVWWSLANLVCFIHFICYWLAFSCLASQPTYSTVSDWFTLMKDRKAILHLGLCKYSLSSLGIAFTHPLLNSFQKCQSRRYPMPATEQDHKRNTMVGFNVSRDAIGMLNVLRLRHWDSSLLHCDRIIAKCATLTDDQDHKRNTTVWYSLFFLSFILVCVVAILTPLVANGFKRTQNHSKVYTNWRHKRNTSIWEHQHNISIDWYVTVFHLF